MEEVNWLPALLAALAAALIASLAAGLIGYAVTWQRVDLDLRPGPTARASALITGCFALIWLIRPEGAAILILFAALGPLTWIDAKRKVLPDPITLPLIALGLIAALGQGRWLDALVAAAAGYVALWLMGWLWLRFRDVDALGQGDAKLLGGIGAFLGWAVLPQIVFIAAIIGIALALIGRARGRVLDRGDEIPFGPALALAAVATWALGPAPII